MFGVCVCVLKLGFKMTRETQKCSLNRGSEICCVSSPTLQSWAASPFICLLQHLFICLACLYLCAPALVVAGAMLPCCALVYYQNQDRRALQGEGMRTGVKENPGFFPPTCGGLWKVKLDIVIENSCFLDILSALDQETVFSTNECTTIVHLQTLTLNHDYLDSSQPTIDPGFVLMENILF